MPTSRTSFRTPNVGVISRASHSVIAHPQQGVVMRVAIHWLLLCCIFPAVCFAQTRDELVRGDKAKVEADGFWMYNDLPGAFKKASQTGKPIVVVLRCIPCHECVKLDDELVDTDPVIRPLLEQFVCVRQVATNGLDLSLFQYDTDQSFAVFFLNADKTIYGRFGTRSHRTEWIGDVSLPGLAKALQGALDLHAKFTTVKQSLGGKRGAPMEFASPEKYPSLKDKFTDKLNYKGDVVKSCIHCHQIGDAQREYYWQAKKPIPESVLFPYPHPNSVGLQLDPQQMATVSDVRPNSAAAAAGFRQGDRIELFNGQPMLSIADVQWVLHNLDPAGGETAVRVQRNNQPVDLTFKVQAGWRRAGDLSWRVTSWGLRRMATGGLLLETLPHELRKELNRPAGTMALRVKHIGQHGPHGAAKRAGFQKGDVILKFDGHDDLLTETALTSYAVTTKVPGDKVSVTILRDGKEKTLSLPMQP
jgi:serine protease Do